jgi:hypothetical protein
MQSRPAPNWCDRAHLRDWFSPGREKRLVALQGLGKDPVE